MLERSRVEYLAAPGGFPARLHYAKLGEAAGGDLFRPVTSAGAVAKKAQNNNQYLPADYLPSRRRARDRCHN